MKTHHKIISLKYLSLLRLDRLVTQMAIKNPAATVELRRLLALTSGNMCAESC